MDNWDDEDFEPTLPETKGNTDKWEGEDEDTSVKDNWDDEEEDKPKPVKKPQPDKPKELKKGGKKYLQKVLKEKEEQKRRELEERMLKEENKTPEEKMADRLLAQKLAEESELEIVKGDFNMDEIDSDKLTIDSFEPRTKEDFIKFSKMLQDKLAALENSPHYYYLLESVVSAAIIKLDSEDLKKLTLPINALANAKLKSEKQQKKGTKKTAKVKLGGGGKSGKSDMLEDYSKYDDYNDDFDDFM